MVHSAALTLSLNYLLLERVQRELREMFKEMLKCRPKEKTESKQKCDKYDIQANCHKR